SEPQNFTWGLSATTGAVGGIVSFAGVDTGNPINVETGVATNSALTHQAPTVTTTVAKAMIVTAHTYASSSTWTPPATLTEALDVASGTINTAGGQSLEMNYGIKAAAGATGTFTATASGANADRGNTETLTLRPAGHQYYS